MFGGCLCRLVCAQVGHDGRDRPNSELARRTGGLVRAGIASCVPCVCEAGSAAVVHIVQRVRAGISCFSLPPPPSGLCFRCNRPGHMARDCPYGYSAGTWDDVGAPVCLRCGREDCPCAGQRDYVR